MLNITLLTINNNFNGFHRTIKFIFWWQHYHICQSNWRPSYSYLTVILSPPKLTSGPKVKVVSFPSWDLHEHIWWSRFRVFLCMYFLPSIEKTSSMILSLRLEDCVRLIFSIHFILYKKCELLKNQLLKIYGFPRCSRLKTVKALTPTLHFRSRNTT